MTSLALVFFVGLIGYVIFKAVIMDRRTPED